MNVILTHDHSDFDAVASQLGAWKLHPAWVPVLGRYLNHNVRDFLTLHWEALPFLSDDELPAGKEIERAMLVDVQVLPALKGVGSQPIPSVKVVDHHTPRSDLPAGWEVTLDRTGACTTLFVEAIADQGLSLSWVESTLLLLGIHEDTGSLVYAGTTARDVRAAAWLLEQGADLDLLRRYLDHPLNEQQRELYRRLLEGSEFVEVNGFQVVLAHATMDDYVDDISSLAHSIRDLYDPAALVLVVKMGEHIQLVARSTTSEIDVGRLMSHFDGGGHNRAAAAFVEAAALAGVLDRLRALLPEHVQPAVKVGDWMSRGKIRSFSPRTRITEAAERMRRWGHEGFPVVDEAGGVVGVLTRRDVDRALQHKLGNAPVTEFMHKGNLSVTPADSIARVQRVMTENNIGQVPVVSSETNEIIGIITRTDLLRRMGERRAGSDADEIMRKVQRALPPETVTLVRRIAREASEQGFHPYLVGGIVRDLLLGSPLKDLDIVIEGDAIRVARKLAANLGGRVVSHKRFGTAKWLLREASFPPRDPLLEAGTLPESIDLISARTEFYDRPTALPHVEHASIKQDLHRRDFTINTLAISLQPGAEGQLLDFYGGKEDLEKGVLRVLHNLSFVEDPTRILRAIRFEQRFDFQMEARTKELLLASLDLLEQVSPDRLRHELYLILAEIHPERTLARLDELGILRLLLPDVHWDASDAARMQRLRKSGFTAPEHLLAALIWDPEADLARIDRVGDRLALSKGWRNRQQTLYEVRAQRDKLVDPELPTSQLYFHLRDQDPLALDLLATLTTDQPLRDCLRLFLDDLRNRSLAISGEELRASALPPGPQYSVILDHILAAMLDGLAPDEASQRALLQEEVEKRL